MSKSSKHILQPNSEPSVGGSRKPLVSGSGGKVKERCKKMIMWSAIYQGGHRKQCSRYAVKDGYCKVHHPEEEKKRGDIKAQRIPVRLWGLLKERK